jgi:hypothetical protein
VWVIRRNDPAAKTAERDSLRSGQLLCCSVSVDLWLYPAKSSYGSTESLPTVERGKLQAHPPLDKTLVTPLSVVISKNVKNEE